MGIEEFREPESSFNDMAERLDEAERGLVRSYEGQRKILDEIPVGLLTVGPDYRIGPEYSAATDDIFSTDSVVGVSLIGLLVPSESDAAQRASDGGAGARAAELERYLRQFFENTTADEGFLGAMNPIRDLTIAGPEGRRNLEVAFTRIYDGERVSDLLVRIADRTKVIEAERALEEERRSHKRDSDSIQAILSVGPGPLKDLFVETREVLGRIRERLGSLSQRESVNACFRELHSIKGAAGSFGIEAAALTAHEAEDIFAALRDGRRAPSTAEQVRIKVLLGTIGEELDAFEDLVRRLKATLARLEAQGERRTELQEFLESLGPMVGQLERSLVKPMELVTDVRVDSIPHLKEMRRIIIHLIRNAADHGLEDEYERLFRGKPKRGAIKLSIRSKGGAGSGIEVEVEDDWQGLDFDRIASRGAEMGLAAPGGVAAQDKGRLLALLFSPGFSTKDKVDEISGRGVGLDLVRDIVKSLGGGISMGSARGVGSRFSVTIPA